MTTATITGPVYGISQAWDFIHMSIVFELSQWDRQEDVGLFASGPIIVPVDSNGNFSVELMVNTLAENGTHYQCFLQYRRTDGTEWIREPIGIFTLVSAGVYKISELSITPMESKVTTTLDVYNLVQNLADVAETSVQSSASASISAQQYRDEAQTARDAAFVNADVYSDTAEGLAATSVGDQFQVVTGNIVTRYKHDSGPTATQVATYPALSLLGYQDIPCSVGGTVNAIEITPLTGLNGVSQVNLFSFVPSGTNTLIPSINIVGVTNEQRTFWFPGGTDRVPSGFLSSDSRYVVYYDNVTGKVILVSPQPHYMFKVPVNDDGTSTAISLQLVSSIQHSLSASASSNYVFTAISDRGVGELAGMTVSINGDELRQLLHPDGSQIEAETWVAGDTLEIGEFDATIGGRPLISPSKPSAAGVATNSGTAARLAEIRFSTILEDLI